MIIKVKIANPESILYGIILQKYNEQKYLYMVNIMEDNVECKCGGFSINIPKDRIRIY